VKIEIPKEGENVLVTGKTPEGVEKALKEIEAIIQEQKDKVNKKEEDYQKMKDEHERETQLTDELYQKHMKEVDEHAAKRSEYHEEANKEYEAGNKERAAELREKAKQEGELMEATKKKAFRAIFEKKYEICKKVPYNSCRNEKFTDGLTIDLHGLQIAPAIEFLTEKIDQLKVRNQIKG
jgi:hypothetical protein